MAKHDTFGADAGGELDHLAQGALPGFVQGASEYEPGETPTILSSGSSCPAQVVEVSHVLAALELEPRVPELCVAGIKHILLGRSRRR